ncbi:MAG: hypothetical protein L6W00_19875 [Lentisphaeria bacterium]|nr:MAG: hypothetical protein L6W00_19875 [Lentisphaeria bacterium]
MNLLYAECCRLAGELAEAAGVEGSGYADRRARVLAAVNQFCYAEKEQLYTDVPGRPWYSQHANAWAVLAGAATGTRAEKAGGCGAGGSAPWPLHPLFFILPAGIDAQTEPLR